MEPTQANPFKTRRLWQTFGALLLLIGGMRWSVVRSELQRASFAKDVTQRGAHLTVVESLRWPQLPPMLREIWRRRSLTVDIPTEAALET